MTTRSGIPGTAASRMDFVYDYLGRRVQKRVYDTPSSTQPTEVYEYVYDGWNLIAAFDGSGNLEQSYLWGLDLSGTLQGAGGVGGLLAVTDHTIGLSCHYVATDGNGNIKALLDEITGNPSAIYEYGPFGEPIRMSGPMARANPFRFSTKFVDDESGLLYYGMRYYNPTTGSWISRDPIGEDGGLNIYCFVRNSPINLVDYLGLESVGVWLRTEIRAPDPEAGTKTLHFVELDEFGQILDEFTNIDITADPIPMEGLGTLAPALVSGSHPRYTIRFKGTALSPYLSPSFIGAVVQLPSESIPQLFIDYDVVVTIDFCSRTGEVGGEHDGYPSYVVSVAGERVYDFQQTLEMVGPVNFGVAKLLPPMDQFPKKGFRW